MDKKEGLLLGLFVLGLVVILSTLVLGVVTVRTSTGGTTYNVLEDLGSFRINISVNNTDAGLITNITNVTLTIPSHFVPINVTNGSNLVNAGTLFSMSADGTTLRWVNQTFFLINGTGGITNNAFFWINVSPRTPGIYNISVDTTILNGTAHTVRNSNISVRVNDTTVANVQAENITMVAYNNNSGTVIFNVSVGDNSIVNAVFFNITNASGDVAKANATNPTGTFWNSTFNTATLADGKYNVTVYANDTYGVLVNNTAIIEITIDNTDPSGSVTCNPDSVEKQATTTCTCSGSDALSGVNSTSITANPDTTQTGTFTSTCLVTDLAGNVGTVNGQYTVTGSGSSGGSSGSGLSPTTTWTATYTVTDADFASGVTRDVAEKKRLQVNVAGATHYVGVLDVMTNSAKLSISSTPQEATMNVGETRKFEVTDDNFYDMQVTLVSVSGNTASVSVQSIYEEMPSTVTETTTAGSDTSGTVARSGLSTGMIAGIVIAVLIIAIVAFFLIRRR